MSPLSDVQFSRFTETEVAKILTFGSRGLLEVMVLLTDDERRGFMDLKTMAFRARVFLVPSQAAKSVIVPPGTILVGRAA